MYPSKLRYKPVLQKYTPVFLKTALLKPGCTTKSPLETSYQHIWVLTESEARLAHEGGGWAFTLSKGWPGTSDAQRELRTTALTGLR